MMPQHGAGLRHRHGGNRIGAAVPTPQAAGHPWSSAVLTAGVVALLLSGISTAVSDAVAGSTPAPLPGAEGVHAAESENGRLRSRMIVAHLATGTHLIFEVQLRDRTWMAPDQRLLRVVVRGMPEYGLHEPFAVARSTTRSGAHEHPDRTPEGNPNPPAFSASFPPSPHGGAFTYRSEIVAAATLPDGATGFTYFTAALDVSGLKRGDYIASVELMRRAGPGSWEPRKNVIDRVLHPYEAW
ncbi:hypothetical protein [Planctomonas deserti]|uniref:hypothetical protein n=1 Tax=Planctomonas deserti TaxID=2144185 RepID=UPI000D389E19|nr:hypothetical protein [Planctomonas deserti]